MVDARQYNFFFLFSNRPFTQVTLWPVKEKEMKEIVKELTLGGRLYLFPVSDISSCVLWIIDGPRLRKRKA